MFEVVTAVAWDECEGIVMVTIVLVGACVCDTDPGQEKKGNSSTMASLHTLQILKNPRKALGKKKENFSNLILVLCLKLRNKE